MSRWAVVIGVLALAACAFGADAVELGLTGTRTRFTNQEPVELALLYRNDGADAKSLPLEIRHEDGSTLTIPVPVDAAAGKSQSRIVAIKAGALKPGTYTATVKLGAEEDAASFSVHPAEHANAFWTAQWVHFGATEGTTLAKGGWMYMNSDLVSLHPRKPAPNDTAEWYVAAGMRPYALMILGGGHQLDLDLLNDWGDPWVQRAVAWRMQLGALTNRIYPMAGLHCYDEPGLTWWPVEGPDGKQIGMHPYIIPHQLEEFEKLTGKKLPTGPFEQTGPQYGKMMDAWLSFIDMRMKYLGQAWEATMWATKAVHPAFTAINQVSSSYAPGDTTDGVDGRQSRPYEIVSGHGGYSDQAYGTFQPVRSAEAFWTFSREKPHYYLPMWYTHDWATIRNAIWMSWTTKLDGLMYTPEQDFGMNNEKMGYLGTHTILEIAEINRRLALVGDVMNQLKKTLSPVAVLHSHSQNAWDIAMASSPGANPANAVPYYSPHNHAVDACFWRVMECGIAPNWIDEPEAVEKGAALLNQWKVIFCPALSVASPQFQKVLQDYAAAGGKLIQHKGDKLQIKGAIIADHAFGDTGEYYKREVVEKAKAIKDASTIFMPAYRDLSWRKWNASFAPSFAKDLAGWLGELPYSLTNKEMLLGVHKAGEATYLLIANNAMDRSSPRGLKHELIPAETDVNLPPSGVVYDLFNGGVVPVKDGVAKLKLAAGDGACWLHLPAEAGKPAVSAQVAEGNAIKAEVSWGRSGFLPFRLRVLDPAGNAVTDLYRATTPGEATTTFSKTLSLGTNAAPGAWTVEVSEWLTGSTATAKVDVKPIETAKVAVVDPDAVSVYFDDTQKITDLFAGKAAEPDYAELNWDAKRVFGLDAKKFAVFGPAEPAEKLAAALRAKGMRVQVNPEYKIEPFKREPNRGGSGPTYGATSNYENIHAHTIVLPGHKLAEESMKRGHINRPVTATFPGPGRAYIQWGSSCFQAGWQNVFAFGDLDASMAWLLEAINGKVAVVAPAELGAAVKAASVAKPGLPGKLEVTQQIKTADTPVGVAISPDGKTTFVLLFDGSVMAYDGAGKELWKQQALIEGCALGLSPKGDRLAVAGYPGMVVLDAADGKVLGGYRVGPPPEGFPWTNRIISVAWNSAGTMVAAGWNNNTDKASQPMILLDAQGKQLPAPKDVKGSVMGVAFVPNSDILLVGADKLTAVKASDGTVLWSNDIKGASAFAFNADGKQAAAGGWGRNAGKFDLADRKLLQAATFDSVIGGVAFRGDDVVVAVWGGTHPLYVIAEVTEKDKAGKDVTAVKGVPLFTSSFGFQSIAWSAKLGGLLAAEQGGKVWLLAPDGKPRAMLDENAGTTAYRLLEHNGEIIVARMNRLVQRIAVR